MSCFVCDCSGSLMLSQLNTTKLNEIMPTLNIFILNTHVGIGLYTTPTSAKWLVMFCSVP